MKLTNKVNLKTTLLSGQAFRITAESDNSFTCILKDRVINVKINNGELIIDSNNLNNIESIIKEYFDLERDYESINNQFLTRDLKEVITYNERYKILKQDKFEMLISYIISQNNTVKNITNSINKLSTNFGKKIVFRNKEYYLFPTYEDLKNISEQELKECKVGFRSKYILNALDFLNKNNNFLESINNLSSEEALCELMKIKGVGYKVASCMLLFGYSRFDVFPIDTWVKKYFNSSNEKEIRNYAKEKFGNYSGLIIQYMFNYSRNKDVL